MKIIVSQQQNKKITIEFHYGGVVETYSIDRAEDFLVIVDKFLKKSNNELTIIKNTELEFVNTGVLTERIIRSIIVGLNFS
jgi:hypothetical protein